MAGMVGSGADVNRPIVSVEVGPVERQFLNKPVDDRTHFLTRNVKIRGGSEAAADGPTISEEFV